MRLDDDFLSISFPRRFDRSIFLFRGDDASRRKRRKKIAYDPSSERARRIKEKHERDLAGEVARQEESARKRRAVIAELVEAWLDDTDDGAAGAFLLDLTEYASVSDEKLLSTHPRFPGNA